MPPRRPAALFASLLLFLIGNARADQVLESRRLHLGVEGMPEWDEFATTKPDAPQIDLTFQATANTREATLLIRQRDVKTAWNVVLNGRRLGALETLAQPLIRALAVPPGALKEGTNRLTIARGPARMLDDIVVGEISLVTRPRDDFLGQCTVEIGVTENGAAVPCRLTLVDVESALVPLAAAPDQRLAVRTGVVYTGDGRAILRVPPGRYTLYATRGFEYGVATQTLAVNAGEHRRVALRLDREVPTPGLIAADSHIHTVTFSKHGDATVDERMLTIAGEGIELAVATDHNHHADFGEPAARQGVAAHFRSIVGNEITTPVGHFNAFPVALNGPVPDVKIADWPHLLAHIRQVTGARVVTLNHPRDLHGTFTPFGADNFDPVSGALKSDPNPACDAVEVVTSAALQSDPLLLFHDWFALLNRGHRIAAIAASDTHTVSEFILGQARTYVVCRAPSPDRIDFEEVWASYRAGRLLVSFGLLTQIKVDGRFGVGDLATGLGAEIAVEIEVVGPSWVHADHVALFANGLLLREEKIAATDRTTKAHLLWRIPRPRHDIHLVAIATGPGVTAPYWETPRPYQPTTKAFVPRLVGATNPVWLDADGDGTFTAARGYAARVIKTAAGDATKRQAALAGYDAAVAAQAADLLGSPPAQKP